MGRPAHSERRRAACIPRFQTLARCVNMLLHLFPIRTPLRSCRRRTLQVGAVGLLVGATAGSMLAQPSSMETCEAEPRWSAPVVQRVGRSAPVTLVRGAESLSIVQIASRPAALAGREARLGGAQITVQTHADRSVPPLTTPSEPVAPRAVATPAGDLVVIWGEKHKSTPDRGGLDFPHTLWSARYTAGRWTAPHRLYKADWIAWDEVTTSGPVVDSAGVIHLAAGVNRLGSQPAAIVHLALHGDRQEVREVPIFGAAHYVSLATGPGDALRIAYIAPDSSARGGPATIYLLERLSTQRDWAPPLLLAQAPMYPPTEVRIVAAHGGGVAVVWGQGSKGSIWARSLQAMMTTDAGRTWSRPVELDVHGTIDRLGVAMDACGRTHVVGRRTGDTDGSQLVRATLSTRGWSFLIVQEPAYLGYADLTTDRFGRAHLVWWRGRAGHEPQLLHGRLAN